jgi:Family of unknown function (DUF5522)
MPEDLTFSTAPETELIATSADFDKDGTLSRDFLLRRGRCCQEGYRNCPYGFVAGNEKLGDRSEWVVR